MYNSLFTFNMQKVFYFLITLVPLKIKIYNYFCRNKINNTADCLIEIKLVNNYARYI